ncbi:MAG: alpha-2-macroglobulin, partial [Planctomycetota bacterium]
PELRRADQTRLEVRYSPTLAGAMVEALPYLIDYPHGCTEQTLNRFLPAVLTQKTLRRMGVRLEDLAGGGAAGLDPQARDGDQPAWRRGQLNPVYSQAELDAIVATGVQRLTDMQLDDGGWGWFSGYGERSTAHTTAVVVRGLLVARDNGVEIDADVLRRGLAWLGRRQQEQLDRLANAGEDGKRRDADRPAKRYADNLDALTHLVLTQAGEPSAAMRDRLFQDRKQLAPYSLAMLGFALHVEGGQADRRDTVLGNLLQYLVTDDENQTAYLNLPGGQWWRWYGSEYEAHAFLLKLLTATDPGGDTAAGVVKHLLASRRHATYWNSTRDTALVVEAMADYLQATGEGRQDLSVEVWLDGQRRKKVAISADNLMAFDNRLVIEGAAIEPGRHTLELRKRGGGRLYWNATLENFTLEDGIAPAGLEVRVTRRLYKLTPKPATQEVAGARGQVVRQATAAYERTELTGAQTLQSGDLVEVELTLTSKNDYEYLLLTDEKAAGCEPVDVRSGYTGNELGAYVEYRDATVNLFLRGLARGARSVSYRLRAETPGDFSALPATVAAMYAPALRGNSGEGQVRIEDAGPDGTASGMTGAAEE